jgi:hypothetical protein
MLALLILSVIIGIAVSGFSGFPILGLLAGGFVFFCGLPGALITSFVHGEVSYAQDRADWRQYKADLVNSSLAEEYEYAEDIRIDRLIETAKKNQKQVFYDNRQVHFHAGLNQDREERN